MRFVAWNVNGIRSVIGKGFSDSFLALKPDLLFVGETKWTDVEGKSFPTPPEGYVVVHTSSKLRKGYSGTAAYYRLGMEPLSVHFGLEDGSYDEEGRIITLEYPAFYFVGAYVPNSGEELKRLPYRMEFEERMREYLLKLDAAKPVVYCGDLNVAHEAIDLKNPDQNTHNAGFTIEEREKMTALLESGFIDSFRYLHPTEVAYSWWSYRFHAREKNAGWRIDYFIVSPALKGKIKKASIHGDIYGSDHCPVSLELDLN